MTQLVGAGRRSYIHGVLGTLRYGEVARFFGEGCERVKMGLRDGGQWCGANHCVCQSDELDSRVKQLRIDVATHEAG